MKSLIVACFIVLLTFISLSGQAPCDYNCGLANANRDIAARPGDGSGYLIRAQVHYYYKQYDSAIADCTKALSLPGYGGTVSRIHYENMVYDTRSQAYFDKGDYHNAIRDLSAIISRSYSSGGSSWHWARANAYFNVRNYQAALTDYNTNGAYLASRKESPGEYFYLYRGETHFYLKNYDAAITDLIAYAKVLADRRESPSGQFYRFRAEAYYLSRKNDPAYSDLTIALTKDPKDVDAYILRGRVLNSMGNTAGAIDDFTKAIALRPQGADIYVSRALAYDKRREYDLAIADYSQAIKLNPDLPDYLIYRSMLYSIKKDFDLAIADMSALISKSPDSVDYYWHRGRFYFLKKDYGSAIADQTQVIKLRPQEASGYCLRAGYFEKKADRISALADFAKAIEFDPLTGYGCRSNYYMEQRKFDLALADARKAIETSDKQLGWLNGRLGEILLLQGKLDEALESLNKEIAFWPQARALRLRGEVYVRKGNYEAALSDAEQIFKKFPTYYDGYLLTANIYRERGDLTAAAYEYSRALEADSDIAEIYYNRALLFVKMKKTADAVRDLKKALELNQSHFEAKAELDRLTKPTAKPVSRRPRPRP